MTPVSQSLSCRLNWADNIVLQEVPPSFVWGSKLLTAFPEHRSHPGIETTLYTGRCGQLDVVPAGDLLGR